MKEGAAALTILSPHEIEAGKSYLALKSKAQEILKIAKGLQVRSQPTMDDAAEKKSSVKTLLKEVKRVKEDTVDPINKRKGQILELFKALSIPLTEADDLIGKEMAAYQTEMEAKERKRQEEIHRKQEEERKRAEKETLEAQRKLDEAQTEEEIEEATSEAVEAEQKLEKSYEPPASPKKFAPKVRRTAGGGSVSFRAVPKFEVVDASKLPREYLMPDTAKIGKIVKAGVKQIPGVRIWMTRATTTRAGKF